MEEKKILSGFGIVVLDRGWVYVGEVVVEDGWCVVRNSKNIRRWGTERGLGQLADGGPREGTSLDPSGTIRAPLTSVVHTIDSEADKWN